MESTVPGNEGGNFNNDRLAAIAFVRRGIRHPADASSFIHSLCARSLGWFIPIPVWRSRRLLPLVHLLLLLGMFLLQLLCLLLVPLLHLLLFCLASLLLCHLLMFLFLLLLELLQVLLLLHLQLLLLLLVFLVHSCVSRV